MARFTSLDARVERIEFGKTQQGSRFFKVIQLVRGGLREYCFLLRDYKFARDQIVAALSVGEELSPECVLGLIRMCGRNHRAHALGPDATRIARVLLRSSERTRPRDGSLARVPSQC